jgi:hypothetical protein
VTRDPEVAICRHDCESRDRRTSDVHRGRLRLVTRDMYAFCEKCGFRLLSSPIWHWEIFGPNVDLESVIDMSTSMV